MIVTEQYDEKTMFSLKVFMLHYGVSIMDVYMLGRILKKFERSDHNNYSLYAENIIIIAGMNHIKKYKIFFINIGGVVLHDELAEDTYYLAKNPSKRCVKFEPMIV